MVAAPTIIRATAIGADGRPAASQRVVVGYIGVGPRGLGNVQEQMGCREGQVVAVCDVWKHVREQAKQTVDKHYGSRDCRAYVDFPELLARDDIDAVRSDLVSQVSDIAIRLGRKVVWDPAKEQFIGDEQANRMTTRPHRQPWTL